MQVDASRLAARGNDAIEILKNDHQVIKKLLRELTQTTDRQMCRKRFDELKAILTVHNATEENVVYPALRILAGGGKESEHLYQETAAADVLVFKLEGMLEDGASDEFVRSVKKLQEAVLEHIDSEETDAFPLLQQNVQPEQAAMLTDSVRAIRGSFHFDPAA